MALPDQQFTTGPAAALLDVGVLFYNGCTFSPLFESNVSGNVVKDNANRTTKLMEYTITVDGYATLPDGEGTINGVMDNLRTMLTACGGTLTYSGRGMDLSINPPGNMAGVRDVAWGPVPELLEFQPLGAGRSAKVKWTVKVRIPEIKPELANMRVVGGIAALPLLQFNYETSVRYSEDGFSSIDIRGTLEVALTRNPNQKTRTLTNTVDDARSEIERRIMPGIDLTRFTVTNREFNISRDKRSMEWSFSAEEKPYMDLPPDIMVARGSYSVRPAKAGMGLCLWMCTLKATYTVRADRPRRLAWFAFLGLLRRRMIESRHGLIPKPGGNQNPGRGALKVLGGPILQGAIGAIGAGISLWRAIFKAQDKEGGTRKAWLIDFSVDEGLYLDSKTISFSASWRMTTIMSHILLASGIWTKVPEKDANGESLWAVSVKDVTGATSWLPNKLDPKLDIIVDFGGG